MNEPDLKLASDGFRIARERRECRAMAKRVFKPRNGACRRAHAFRHDPLEEVRSQSSVRELAAQAVEDRIGTTRLPIMHGECSVTPFSSGRSICAFGWASSSRSG
jgi:hypothetical protein